jgi:hypothetical protein
VQTPDDGPLDKVRAGMALQTAWLTATDAGLVGAVLSHAALEAAIAATSAGTTATATRNASSQSTLETAAGLPTQCCLMRR